MKIKSIVVFFAIIFLKTSVSASPLLTIGEYVTHATALNSNNEQTYRESQQTERKRDWTLAQKTPEAQKELSKSHATQKNITKKETDLKKPQAYEEVRGDIDKNKIYRNNAFGFSMNLNQPGFSSEVSNQEGYKYNFAHPTASADDNVLSIYNNDFKYAIRFYQSSIQSHVQQSSQDILAHQLSQFNPVVTIKKLDGKELAYTQITKDQSQITDYYAMIVNGYYIKWVISYATADNPAKAKLDTILKSLQFDWISAEK